MKWNDWYLGAGFTVLLWVVSMITIAALALIAGVPMLIVSHVLNILSVSFLMLALVLALVGSGTVVLKDMRRRVRV